MTGLKLKNYDTFAHTRDGIKLAEVKVLASKTNSGEQRRNVISDKAKESIYTELSVLLSAGVNLKSALELLTIQQPKKAARLVLLDVQDKIVRGSGLAEAMKCYRTFSAYEFHSVQIGEETGRLPAVLAELAGFYKRRIRQRRQLIQVLSYPVIVLTTAIGAVAFMLSFIVPMFSDVFMRFGGELPWLTKVIIKLSGIIRDNFIYFAVFVMLFALFVKGANKKSWFKKATGIFLMRLPIVGPIARGVFLARMCGALSLLTNAKVPLVQAIVLVRNMIDFYPIQASLEQVERDLLSGYSLHESLANFNLYDQRMVTLLKVGEETGRLDSFFERMAGLYNDETEHRSSILGTVLEPAIIIFLGAIVGLVLMAMYLPLFELGMSFQ